MNNKKHHVVNDNIKRRKQLGNTYYLIQKLLCATYIP